MSGTAGLSAAKNRRSGNEVKFNGQSKSLPPGEQMHQQPIARQQISAPPNPMEILKSHEFRLQRLESEDTEQDLLNHKVDYLTLKTDFLTLKNELLVNNKIEASTVKNANNDNNTNNANTEVLALQQRVTELNTIITNMGKEIASIKQYVREKVEPVLVKVLAVAPVIAPITQAPVETSVPISVVDQVTEPIVDPVEKINIILSVGC
jgi:predicted phage tail protein